MKEIDYSLELSYAERNGLKPRARHRYAQKLILNSLNMDRDYTISEIMEKTKLSRVTVSRHLESLVSNHQILKKERGMGRIQIGFYRLAGSVTKKEAVKSKKDDSLFFNFFVLRDGSDDSVCIQQKEEDEHRSSRVKGAITIPFDDVKLFITHLNTYSARVVNK